MKPRISRCMVAFLCVCMLGLFSTPHATGGDVPRISAEALKALLGDPDVIILDVRIAKDWASSDVKIKGAVRKDPSEFDIRVDQYAHDKTIVLYCAWPNDQTSVRLTRQMVEKGYTKVFALSGGWKKWLTAGYPVEPK